MPLANRSGPVRDLVFISYSHSDRDWLDRLLVFLKPFVGANFQVWADPYIKDGADWRRDISGVLARSCTGVLLVSPDFLASDFIRNEELPPLLDGVHAGVISLFPIPISASNYKATKLKDHQFAHPASQPLDAMPRPRRNAALVRITEKIAAEVQRIRGDAALAIPSAVEHMASKPVVPVSSNETIAALHGVPSQRPNYLRRQEYIDRLKQALLGTIGRAVGITGAKAQGARVGLHGMGGIGKTVLAIDLVNDDEARRAFPDGMFWLTLGQTIEPLRLQGELAGYIAGEAKAFATVNEARDQLRRLFEGKSCLLVLDDLWRFQDAEAFDVLGPRSRLLVTTRDADLLVALGARELPLDVLGEELAIELLASWSGHARATLPPAADRVAEACGYLPLALALAGARVQGGARWEEALSALQRGRLEFLDHPYGSVFSSLRLSADSLTEFDRDRYFELAVFPGDADIPVETVCTLWRHTGRMEPHASRDLLRRLHRRALLTLHENGTGISFHDLQHDFLRLNVASLAEAHNSMILAYRAIVPAGWANGPYDGYFFQHLPHHLQGADRLDELKALLCDYDWLAAKLRATDITTLLADYDLVASAPDLALIQQALRLSIPALFHGGMQLSGQLLGRLKGTGGAEIRALLAGAERGPGQVWLRPRFASLALPGGLLRQILVGHSGPVDAVALTADGSRALSGSSDNTLRLWDLAAGKTLLTFEGHTKRVGAVAVLADGRRALSGSWDNTLRLWDLTTGETLSILEGHIEPVVAVAVLPDGHRALSGSWDNTLRLWDLTTGATLRILKGHTWAVNAMAVLADGCRALSGSWDTKLLLWDLATGEILRTLEGHTNAVTAVAVLSDGRRAISGSDDHTLRLWDLATGKTLCTLEGHTDGISGVVILADDRRALSGSYDNTMRLWDLTTGEILRAFEGHLSSVTALVALADGSHALSGSEDHTMRLWDLTTKEILYCHEGHSGAVRAVAILDHGRCAISGSDDNTLRVWDLNTGKTLRTLEAHDGITAVVVTPDGRRALFGSEDGALWLWDLITDQTVQLRESHNDGVTAVAALADGSRALSSSSDQTLRLWDLVTGETLRVFEGHEGRITAVALLADGSYALSGSTDWTLRLWDIATSETLRTFEGHIFWVSAVAVWADGRRALSGSYDETLRLWDLASGETLRVLKGHTNSVTAVAVLGDGSRALSGSEDKTLRLWDPATGECLAEYVADAAIGCVAFARDDMIVAGSEDGRIHILEIREP
jgi:WD40 repeat protein